MYRHILYFILKLLQKRLNFPDVRSSNYVRQQHVNLHSNIIVKLEDSITIDKKSTFEAAESFICIISEFPNITKFISLIVLFFQKNNT